MKTFRICAFVSSVFLFQSVFAAGLDVALLETDVKLRNGTVFKLADIVGEKPVYLKFWASWCVPCREEMPHLERIYQKYSGDLEIVSVNIWINETEEAITATKDEFGLTVPIAMDFSGALAQGLEFVGTPYHVLIDRKGELVHKGYQANAGLDQKIDLLAAREDAGLLPIASTQIAGGSSAAADHSAGVTVLFFTATWCDWYLQDSRPAMSQACIEAQRTMNDLYEQQPGLNLIGLASRLWTGEKELQEYVDKYAIAYPVSIDTSNETFFSLNVKTVPTLIVMNNGKEVSRTSRLESAKNVADFMRKALFP